MRISPLRLLSLGTLLTAAFLGCSSGNGADVDGGTGPALDDAGNPVATGVPCDVETMLSSYCWSCHGVTPSGGAPSRLVTYGDLTKTSVSNGANTEAEQALARMKDTTSPMPPSGPAPSASEIAAFEAWVTGGAAQGASCGGDDAGMVDPGDGGPNPYNTPLQCSSGKTWFLFNGLTMRPGDTCINCHVTQKKCTKSSCNFRIAGTVYPTAHEPTNCNGLQGPVVVVTDANNTTVSLATNSVGTFTSTAALVAPFTVKVTYNGKTRAMSAKAPNGDCNSCHTATGTQNAPGRIMAP